MGEKVKSLFPSRNYMTLDTFGDCRIVFNPEGEGFHGDDELRFRRGRWAFRINDFLAGKVLPDGSKEGMNRKIYNLNVVWNEEDEEPIVGTTYIDPTSVIPLDGALVEVGNKDLPKESTLLSVEGHLSAINTALTTVFDSQLKEIKTSLDGVNGALGQIYYKVMYLSQNDAMNDGFLMINRNMARDTTLSTRLSEEAFLAKFSTYIFREQWKRSSDGLVLWGAWGRFDGEYSATGFDGLFSGRITINGNTYMYRQANVIHQLIGYNYTYHIMGVLESGLWLDVRVSFEQNEVGREGSIKKLECYSPIHL